METLFEVAPVLPGGFTYLPDFLSDAEEHALLETVRELELHPLVFQGFTAKRAVASYGYDYDFTSRSLAKGKPIPAGFVPLVEKVAGHLSLRAEDLAEVLVSRYPPGSVINWHRDAPPFDLIAGVSLLRDCTFQLRPYDASKRSRKSVLSLPIRRRSLYIIGGEARTDWEHRILPVTDTRFSITLRTLRTDGSPT